MKISCRRYGQYVTVILGVPPLFLLMVLFYANYSPPTQLTTSHFHLAYRPKKVEHSFTNVNVEHDRGNFVTSSDEIVISSDKSVTIADKIVALPNKFLTFLHRITHKDPDSTVIIEIPFSKSYSENYRYLLPRAAFFDKRVRGKHKNATVVLTHVIKGMVKLVGCVVDGQVTNKVELRAINVNGWIHAMHPECTHDDIIIFCFDTPGRNNSEVSVMYENPKNKSEIFITESEYPLFVPKSREYSKDFASSVMACTTVFGTPPYFGAWLRYQKTLGVDFVYVNTAESFLCGDAYKDTFLQESIRTGFVQLKVWKEYLDPHALYYHSQALYYQNCVYRFQGVYNYAIMSDFDDFVIPIRGKDISQIVQAIFDPKPKLGGIQLDWLQYFEPDGGFDYKVIMAGNFTQYIADSRGKDERNHKSIHKLSATSDVGIHKVARQMQGYNWIRAPRNMVYMAHFKNKNKMKHYDTAQC